MSSQQRPTVAEAESAKEEGNRAFLKNELDKAIECYTRAIQIDPNNHIYYSNRSAAYYKSKKYKEAAEDAKKSVEIEPKFSKGYFRLGQAALALKDYSAAKVVFQKALQIDPNNKELQKCLKTAEQKEEEMIAIQKKKDNIIKRIGTIQGTLRVDLETNNLYYENLGRKYAQQYLQTNYSEIAKLVVEAKQEKEADAALFNLTKTPLIKKILSKNAGMTLFVIACILFQFGLLDIADVYIKRALEKEKSNVEFWVLLSLIDIYHEQNKNGLKYIRKALELQPNHLLMIRVYLEILEAIELPTQIDGLKEILNDLVKMLNATDLMKDSIIQTGLRAWFLLVNIAPGAVQQLRDIMDYQLNEKDSRINTLKIFNSHITMNQPLIKACFEEFFLKALRHVIIPRPDMEMFLSRVRECIIQLDYGKIIEEMIPFHCELAMQCHNTQYAWAVKDDEQQRVNIVVEKVEQLLEKVQLTEGQKWELDPELQHYLLLTSMYKPLIELKGSHKLLSVERSKLLYPMALIIRRHVVEPFRVQQHISSIKSITDIKNETSIKQANYYKDNIYPLWRDYNPPIVNYPMHKDVEWRHPTRFWPQGFEKKCLGGEVTRCLFVGCGTGKDVITAATTFENVEVVGIDVCKESLSYLSRQLKKHSISNVKLYCGDLTLLEPSHFNNQLFDFIDASNVLGSVDDPIESMKTLTKLLRPGGVIRISLSTSIFVDVIRVARSYLNQCRLDGTFSNDPLFDSSDFPQTIRNPTTAEKRQARALIQKNQSLRPLVTRSAFFELNNFSDPIFNPKIKGFTFEDVGRMIDEADLKFIAFERIPANFIEKYLKEKPNDPFLEDFKAVDQFHKRNYELLKSTFTVVLEKPAPKPQVSKSEDPLGLKNALYNLTRKRK